MDNRARPLAQASVKSVGRVQITDHIEVKNRSVYHVRNNVASELFMINTCSPGKLKIEVIPFGFRKSLKRKRKKKTRKLLVIQGLKGVREEQIEEVFSEMANWPAMVAA